MINKQIQETDIRKLNREERGKLIFERGRIAKKNNYWIVGSQTSFRAYKVSFNGHEPTCTCPDCQLRKGKCKHIYAVEFYIKREIDEEGKITETKGVKVTYAQKWSAYNKSQTSEKLVFMRLLKDLCENIEQPVYIFGRPTLPFADMLFGSVMKVYTGFSLRRFMSDMKIAKEVLGTPLYNCGEYLAVKYLKDETRDRKKYLDILIEASKLAKTKNLKKIKEDLIKEAENNLYNQKKL